MRSWLALLLILSGVVLMGVVVGDHYRDGQQTAQAQAQLMGEVPDAAQGVVESGSPRGRAADPFPTATPVGDGEALVAMRIPRFGDDWQWTAAEGTSPTVLESGPGHYEGTALPGERGNTAFAAHRAGHGNPFIEFDALRAGDHVLLTQGETTWDYVIDHEPRIIPVAASWVLAPTAERSLTLTTCWPRYGSTKRMYVRAHLARG